MELIEAIDAPFADGRLELLVGDLSDVPGNHAADVLVVSAFPGDYTPTATSLIGALHRKGLSVAKLAASKAYDLRDSFGCWLSEEITPTPGLPFKRILCFEPEHRGSAPELVGDIFRALEPFSLGPPFVKSVAMPLVTTGNQGMNLETVGAALVDAAWNRLNEGHPIELIKIVAWTQADADRVTPFFNRYPDYRAGIVYSVSESDPAGPTKARALLSQQSGRDPEDPQHSLNDEIDAFLLAGQEYETDERYDAFVSYSRKDQTAANLVAEQLKAGGLRVFIDQLEIDLGFAWQRTIFEALENCHLVVALYSPEFVKSKVCQDEFAAAMILRRRRDNDAFIMPLLVRETSLPAYMEMINFSDCRESDAEKLRTSAVKIAGRFQRPPST